MRFATGGEHFSLDSPEIVRRLLNRPVTAERAIKILHLLKKPSQLAGVLELLADEDRAVIEQALTPQVVAQHFARRAR